MDHFCPSSPGVTPGPQDHSYTRVWCNTRPLGPLSARVWCNTRPPGPLQPPSGELVMPATPSWEFPGIMLRNSWNSAGPLSWHSTRTQGPPPGVLLGLLPPPVALLGETRPLGSFLPRDFSSGPDLLNLIAQVCACACITLLKRQNTPHITVFSFREQFISQCLVGSHNCTKPVVKRIYIYMCVCVRHIIKRRSSKVYIYVCVCETH